MPVPSGTSSLLLGREREIGELGKALGLAAQGTPQVVLVGGDAGIGKTTLVTELGRRALDVGFTVATGHCLDLEAGISFAPVVEAVRSLVGGLEDLGPRPSARRMLTLLDPEAPRSREAFRVLDDLTAAVLEAAAAGPVMVVLEDMHWADRSTQDFATSLSRTARGRLLMVLTFRSDELHRHHPFRKTVTEMSRTAGSRRIDLAGLDRDSIAGIAAAHTDGPSGPSVVDSVLARSEGNPLYAEELLAANQEGVPSHLSDLLLARIDALDEGPRDLLRLASVNGTRLDTDTLAELAGLDLVHMERCLREALDANVLRQHGGHLTFRHPLLREAAYDDLLPDERTRIHARLAEILQARVDAERESGVSALSRLAFHCTAAHDLPGTLSASVRAGLAAKQLGAAEAISQLDRALSLWDRVPDAETVAQHPRVELVVLLAGATHDQGDFERTHALVREAIDMLRADTDPLLASRVYSALNDCWIYNDETLDREEAIRLAIEFAGDQPTEELARALCAQSSFHLYGDHRIVRSLDAATRAIEVAEIAGCADVRVDALRNRASALSVLGRTEEAVATQRLAIEVSRDAGWHGRAIFDVGELAGRCIYAGQVDKGRDIASQGFEEGLALGLGMQAAMCAARVHEVLTWRGRFSEAERLLEELLVIAPGRWRALRLNLLMARGDAQAAFAVLRDIMGGVVGEGAFLAEVEVAAMLDDVPLALDAAHRCIAEFGECESPLISAAVALVTYRALALAPPFSDGAADGRLRDSGARHLALARAGLTAGWRKSVGGVELALAEAWAARVAGQPAVAHFRSAVALADPFGAYFALEPRLNLATELLAHGDRDEGRELLVECWSTAHFMGARDLERRAIRLATRTRVPLPESATSDGPLSRLTPREREVLDLLATGATNKTIATTLFITEKTASVHVSNILGKLDVANRGAAAALARQLVG